MNLLTVPGHQMLFKVNHQSAAAVGPVAGLQGVAVAQGRPDARQKL